MEFLLIMVIFALGLIALFGAFICGAKLVLNTIRNFLRWIF
jgi:hypothetical protein